MGLAKTQNFTAAQNDLAELARVLSSPTRVAILEYLLEADCCICRDLTNFIGLSQPTISKHLAELRNAGLIIGEVDGTSRKYCIDVLAWKRAQEQMLNLFGRLPGGSCAT